MNLYGVCNTQCAEFFGIPEFQKSASIERTKMKGPRFEAIQLLVKHSEEYTVETEHNKSKEEYYKSILTQ